MEDILTRLMAHLRRDLVVGIYVRFAVRRTWFWKNRHTHTHLNTFSRLAAREARPRKLLRKRAAGEAGKFLESHSCFCCRAVLSRARKISRNDIAFRVFETISR